MLLDPALTAIPASNLKLREVGQIRSISGDEKTSHRLAEMGIRPGASFQVVRHGKTSLIAVDGRKFSLRAEHLTEILVCMSAGAGE